MAARIYGNLPARSATRVGAAALRTGTSAGEPPFRRLRAVVPTERAVAEQRRLATPPAAERTSAILQFVRVYPEPDASRHDRGRAFTERSSVRSGGMGVPIISDRWEGIERLRCVDVPVTQLEREFHRALAGSTRQLPGAEPERGHAGRV